MKQVRNIRIVAIGLVATSLTLYYVTQQVEKDLFFHAIQTAEYRYVLLCMFLLLLGLVTRALRWQALLQNALPLSRSFSIMNVAYLVNGVLPLRIGEVARVYLASRVQNPVPIPKTVGSIIIERLLDLISIVFMVLLAISLGPVPDDLRTASIFAALFALLGFVVLIVLVRYSSLSMRIFQRTLMAVPRIGESGVWERWFQQFLDGLQPLTIPHLLVQALFWTTTSWALSIMAGYVLMFAFFEDASFAATMLYIAAAAFAIALPAVPGNIGTYEASILLALTAMGYEQSSTAVAFAVMVHIVNVFAHAATGVAGLVQEGISLQQLSRSVQQIQIQKN